MVRLLVLGDPMRASRLIELLQEQVAIYGDRDVLVRSMDGALEDDITITDRLYPGTINDTSKKFDQGGVRVFAIEG